MNQTSPALVVLYRNWRGEVRTRKLIPEGAPYFGKTDWHPVEQWLMLCRDVESDEVRVFAMDDMVPMARVMDLETWDDRLPGLHGRELLFREATVEGVDQTDNDELDDLKTDIRALRDLIGRIPLMTTLSPDHPTNAAILAVVRVMDAIFFKVGPAAPLENAGVADMITELQPDPEPSVSPNPVVEEPAVPTSEECHSGLTLVPEGIKLSPEDMVVSGIAGSMREEAASAMDKYLEQAIYLRVGEVLTCASGHEIGTMRVSLASGELPAGDDVDWFPGQEHGIGEAPKLCSVCPAPWASMRGESLCIGGKWRRTGR